MKKTDLVFAVLLIPIDFIMLMAAGIAAHFLRFQTLTQFRPAIFEIPFSQYLAYVFAGSFFFILIFALSGLYGIGTRKIHNEVQRVLTACSTAMMLVIVFIFFIQELFSSRFIILAAWILGCFFVLSGRALMRTLRTMIFSHGWGLHGLALLGDESFTDRLRLEIEEKPSLGYRVVWSGTEFNHRAEEKLSLFLAAGTLHDILVLDPHISRTCLQEIVAYADANHVRVQYAPDMLGSKHLDIRSFLGVPLLSIRKTRLDGWGKITKAAFDRVGALFLIIATSPVMALAALAVRVESSGPVIYRNERVGKRGKKFFAYKFRSMLQEYCTGSRYDDTGKAEKYEMQLASEKSERKGPVFKILDDPRRTRVGRFLERYSIDELPQLFNVLLGEMSLVGPRPHMPIQVREYEQMHRNLFLVRPGITGLAQIEGRSDLDFEEEARFDEFYIENWSLYLDMIILLKTPFVVLTRKSRV